MSWQCFTDLGTGRSYKSREAVANSETDLSKRVQVLRDCEMRELTSAARRLDHRRMEERVMRRILCAKHDSVSYRLQRTTDARAGASWNVGENCSNGTLPNNTRMMVVRFDTTMLPCTAEPSKLTTVDRQYLLDELRQREAHWSQLQSIGRSLRDQRSGPLALVFTYNDESRLGIVNAFENSGCNFFETPVFNSMSDFINYLNCDATLQSC